MNYNTKCDFIEETLGWETYIPENASSLIIGTFPTVEKRRSFDFFYPNKNNPFWEILGEIANINLINDTKELAIRNRKEILSKLNLGITDMGYKILRHSESSLDQSIFPIEFMDIFKILDDNPKITTLILTSSSGKNSVAGWFRNYCKINNVKLPSLKGRNPKRTNFLLYNRKIQIVCVHSTSKAAAISKNELITMYGNEINSLLPIVCNECHQQ